MKETILLFNVPERDKRLKIERALFPLRFRIKYIAKEDYLKPLGSFFNLKDIEASEISYDGEELEDTMVIFAFLSDQQLNLALAALRKSGAGPLPYKAILTPTNQHWNAIDSFNEIKKEHAAMHQS